MLILLAQWKYTFTTTTTRSIYSTKNNTPLKHKFEKYGKKICHSIFHTYVQTEVNIHKPI